MGSGFGPLGTLTVSQVDGSSIALSDGGRGIDLNGDHIIDSLEGTRTLAPRSIIWWRDGFQQTVADQMQLVRVIEAGMDVDGDGVSDLDPARIYYFGSSTGGIYGTMFMGVEPDVRTGVLTSAGGSTIGFYRLAPSRSRPATELLRARVPPLLNAPGITQIDGLPISGPFFNDNEPLRDGVPYTATLADGTTQVIQAPVINTVPGAMDIQELLENVEWVGMSGDPLAYAPHLRKEPLPGVPAKSMIIQFAKGDENVPNPAETALVRAADLADRTTYYRHDLAYAEDPTLPTNPHPFLNLGVAGFRDSGIALATQGQIATFFASDGTEVIHPEPARFFETPIQEPLPEGLNYIV